MRSAKLRGKSLASTLLVASAFCGTGALAQTAQPVDAETAPTEADEPEIVVTGTLIRDPNVNLSSPVVAIGEDEIELQQANTAEELLRELPGAAPSIGSAVGNGNNGAATVDLRGLGLNRNIVLLDGTRLVPGDLNGAVDLYNLPLALVSRVDVLTGGASTTYGADAVSGVVNFITRRDFSGLQLDLGQQITEEGDGNRVRADLTLGANFEDGRGNAVLSLGYQQSDPVFQGDRDFSIFSISSFTGNQGGSGFTVPARVAIPGVGVRQIDLATGSFRPTSAFNPYNFNPFNLYQTPFERYNLYGAARYEVTSGIEVYSQALFSRQTVSTVQAPSVAVGDPLTIPLSNPFLPAGARNQLCAAFNISPAACTAAAGAVSPTDPAFRTVSIGVLRRFVEAGPRQTDFDTTFFNFRAGVRGDITDSLEFDLYGAYGESENIQSNRRFGSLARLRQAVNATSRTQCLDTSNGCVPIDLFGPEGSVSPEAAAFIIGNVVATTSTKVTLGQARGVVSGDFGVASPLAENPINVAFGAEYRSYTAASSSDAATQTPGEVLGTGGSTPNTFGKYDVKELFGEIVAPLVEDRPFLHSLTLELGGRVSDYSNTGTSFTYKAGGSWEPIRDLRIRGTYQRATRSPNVEELFEPLSVNLDSYEADPCSGSAPLQNASLRAICLAQGAPVSALGTITVDPAGQPNTVTGGNPDLDVEKADTYTLGAVLRPEVVPGLVVSVDYYNITVKDAITRPTYDDAVRACFAPEFNPGLAVTDACLRFRRNPVTGNLFGPAATTPGVSLDFSNQGVIKTDGVDLSIDYRRDLGFADLTLAFNGNWTRSSRFRATPVSVDRECVGFYSGSCGSPASGDQAGSLQPEFSFVQRTTLGFGGVSVSLLWRYIHEMEYEPLKYAQDVENARSDPAGCPGPLDGTNPCIINDEFRTIGSRHYFDLSTRYEVSENFALTATVMNLLDKDPPIVGANAGSTAFNNGGTFPSTYDALGRRFAVGAKLRF